MPWSISSEDSPRFRLRRRSRTRIRARAPTTGTRNPGTRSGSYVACADASQPGVKAIRDYLASLPYKTFNDGNCAPGSYYLVNNYDTGYTFDGKPKELGSYKFVVPPQIAPNIGTRARRGKRLVEMV